MAVTDAPPDQLLATLGATVSVGLIWGLTGYVRARGKGEAFDLRKLGETVVLTVLVAVAFLLARGTVPTQDELVLFAPAVVGVTAGTEKLGRSGLAKYNNDYIPGTATRLRLYDAELRRRQQGGPDETVSVRGVVENNTDKPMESVNVTAAFYDDDRDLRGKVAEVLGEGLEGGESWEFDIEYDGNHPQEIEGYRLETEATFQKKRAVGGATDRRSSGEPGGS